MTAEIQCAEYHSKMRDYISARVWEFDQIPAERKEQLKQLASYVRDRSTEGKPIELTFICTHNSRRSHMSQLWAAVAATHYKLEGVATYSGGTEATAFNPRAVAALERAGFIIKKSGEEANPRYEVTFGERLAPLVCFSKTYDSPPNPSSGFCAVMTCSDADASCPTVHGATQRIALPFEDPKVADGTPHEAAKYDERCAQIAREMLYAFSLATN